MTIRAVILLATLKKKERSNTEALCDFLTQRMTARGIDCETVKLVDHKIVPGTYSDMGSGDEWPKILDRILASDIILFATPVWWGGHSSEMQKVIERLDELHDEILEGKKSKLEGKVGGVVITGDSDGAQHIVGNIGNYFNALGVLLPPFSTLSVLSEKQKKDASTSRDELMKMYEKDYGKTADTMVEQLLKFSVNEERR